jgi:hypothetical protein
MKKKELNTNDPFEGFLNKAGLVQTKQISEDIQKLTQTIIDQNEEMMAMNVEGTRRNLQPTKQLISSLKEIFQILQKTGLAQGVTSRQLQDELTSVVRAIRSQPTLSFDKVERILTQIKQSLNENTYPRSAKDPIAVRLSDGEKFIEAFSKSAEKIVLQTGGGGGRTPSIQLSGGSEAVPVTNPDGSTIGQVASSTDTLTNVSGSASSVTLKAANSSRKKLIVFNDSSSNLYIKYGTTASASSFSYKLAPYDTLEEQTWTGLVTGIWDSATGAARITELT